LLLLVLRSNQPADFAGAVPSTIVVVIMIIANNVKKKRLAVVLYLFRDLHNLYINKKVNFPYLRVISNFSSADTLTHSCS
jgi:hypothetical protein